MLSRPPYNPLTDAGIAYPLYFNFLPSYLATKFTENSSLYLTYRNYCIQSAVGIVGPVSASFLVNTFLGRRWMMGISSIVTGVFLFAYVGVNTPTASLAFSCVTGLLGNFGPFFPREVDMTPCLICDRIRGDVRLHPRVIPWTASRDRDRNGRIIAAVGRSGGRPDLIGDRVHSCADLCECWIVGGGRSDLLRTAVRDAWTCSHLGRSRGGRSSTRGWWMWFLCGCCCCCC